MAQVGKVEGAGGRRERRKERNKREANASIAGRSRVIYAFNTQPRGRESEREGERPKRGCENASGLPEKIY